MESKRSGAGLLRGVYVCAAASIAVLALALVPACASAASPVLEFVSPGNSFPIPFEAEGGEVTASLAGFTPVVHCSGSEGEGEITGPRSTLSNYLFSGCVAQGGAENGHECNSEGADPEEIATGTIAAELVYLNQAKHEVAMLLNPSGGVYMDFECGGESVKATGSFLSPVDPVNTLATSFTAILRRSGASQLPSEYESASGEKRQAIPMGQKGMESPQKTGVELSFTVLPEVPLEIKSVNTAEIELKRHEEAVKKRAEEAAAKKRQEDEAAAKKRGEDEAAAAALAAKERQEEAKARKRHLAKALKQCRKVQPGQKRARCVKRATKKFGTHTGSTKPKS